MVFRVKVWRDRESGAFGGHIPRIYGTEQLARIPTLTSWLIPDPWSISFGWIGALFGPHFLASASSYPHHQHHHSTISRRFPLSDLSLERRLQTALFFPIGVLYHLSSAQIYLPLMLLWAGPVPVRRQFFSLALSNLHIYHRIDISFIARSITLLHYIFSSSTIVRQAAPIPGRIPQQSALHAHVMIYVILTFLSWCSEPCR